MRCTTKSSSSAALLLSSAQSIQTVVAQFVDFLVFFGIARSLIALTFLSDIIGANRVAAAFLVVGGLSAAERSSFAGCAG